VRKKTWGEGQLSMLALAMPYLAAVRLLFAARIVPAHHTRLSLLSATLYLPAPRQWKDSLQLIAQEVVAHALPSGGLYRVEYPGHQAIEVPIEIYRVVCRVSTAGAFSGRDFVVEKGSLRVCEQTPPGDAIPGLEFMISAIPAKAFVDVTTGSSTAAKSPTLYVDPTYFKYDRWHEHYLRYLVTPCPSDTFYRTGSESDTLVNDFLQPAANSLSWNISMLQFKQAKEAQPHPKRRAVALQSAALTREQMRPRT
jgi:hypothetical protein